MLSMKDVSPSAFLLTGPAGCGKGLAALWYAAELNCSEGCGGSEKECGACRKISRLEHPDLHPVFPLPSGPVMKTLPAVLESRREDFFSSGEFGTKATSIGIDLIRELKDRVSRQPYEAQRAVVVVFRADLATIQAQNSFLKLLEEPPGATCIILATEFPDQLLPTITSRCFRIRFDPLSPEAVTEFMHTVYGLSGDELEMAVNISGGNLRRAARHGDSRFLEIGEKAARITAMAIEGKGRKLAMEAQKVVRGYNREEIATLLAEMKRVFRFLMVTGGGEDGSPESSFYRELLPGELLEKGRMRDCPGDLERISRSSRALRSNANTELTLAQLFLDLAGQWY
jgi:DNA polymerase-3 subunit delta'